VPVEGKDATTISSRRMRSSQQTSLESEEESTPMREQEDIRFSSKAPDTTRNCYSLGWEII